MGDAASLGSVGSGDPVAAAARTRFLLAALGEAASLWPSAPSSSSLHKHQGSSEALLSVRLIKGLFQLLGSDMGKKALAWGCPQESMLQPPAATAGKGCSCLMYESLHPLETERPKTERQG